MIYSKKVDVLESYLKEPSQNYRDSFKTDLYLFFNEDFTEDNPLLTFLNTLESPGEIIQWVDRVTSYIVLKFDEEDEQLDDVIWEFVE
jgi:hypothetical protein